MSIARPRPSRLGALLAGLAVVGGSAAADEPPTAPPFTAHRLVVSAGGAFDGDPGAGGVRGGGLLSLRVTAVPRWLAIELGAAALAIDGGVRLPVYLLVEKPFALTRSLELLPAIGPEVVWSRSGGSDGVDVGARAACALLYWPVPRVGLWIEPAFDVLLRDGLQRYTLGVAAGAQLGFP